MPIPELRPAQQTSTKVSDECVLLIAAEVHEAANLVDQLASPTDERFRVEWVPDLSSGIARLRSGGVGAVVLDLALPDSHGLETFDLLFQIAPRVPILLLSETEAEETAKKAVRRGAQDYLLKHQADGDRLRRTVRTMLDRRVAEAKFLENEVANLTLDSIEEAVLRTNSQGNVTYLNRIAEKMTGWRRDQAQGRPVTEVVRLIDGVSRAAVGNALGIAAQEDNTTTLMANCRNCVLVRRDGLEFGIESKVTPLHDEEGNVTGAVVAFHDVSAARAVTLEMSHLAQHDVLTDLPNRVLFNDRLTQSISLAERQGKQLAVMFVIWITSRRLMTPWVTVLATNCCSP